MGNFILPDWAAPLPEPPPPDPAKLREQRIADDTRAESALNNFLAAKQDALFTAPDAFYRTTGEDAIRAAPVATQNLEQLRSDLLDGLANDYQRKRLGDALDAQMQLTRGQMARHVAEQSLVWQRQTAQDRIALLAKEAAYHHNDTDLVDGLGHAAANAARAHARVGDTPLDPETEDAAAATARSGVLGAAIHARLAKGDVAGADALFSQVKDQLDPRHAVPLQTRLAAIPVGNVDQRGTPAASIEAMSDATPEPIEPGQQFANADKPEDDPLHELRKFEHIPPTPTERDKYHIDTHEIAVPPPIGFPGSGRAIPPGKAAPPPSGSAKNPTVPALPGKADIENPTRSWGNPDTLADHFDRHGAGVGAANAEEYVAKANELLQKAQKGEVLMKKDVAGITRAYDPAHNLFGAYNDDGTTRTFYAPDPTLHGRPTNLDYWNSQPGPSNGSR